MEKMLVADIRHLPLVDHGELKGMISIKDLVKTCIKEQDQTIKVLSDFALGKSAYSCKFAYYHRNFSPGKEDPPSLTGVFKI